MEVKKYSSKLTHYTVLDKLSILILLRDLRIVFLEQNIHI